jgi:hypothetical protein
MNNFYDVVESVIETFARFAEKTCTCTPVGTLGHGAAGPRFHDAHCEYVRLVNGRVREPMQGAPVVNAESIRLAMYGDVWEGVETLQLAQAHPIT